MIGYTGKKIAELSGGKLVSGPGTFKAREAEIDSRLIKDEMMFVALKGTTTDGHRFIQDAYKNGARVFMISDLEMTKEYAGDLLEKGCCDFILVEKDLEDFQDFAGKYFRGLSIDSIVVTGSVGKTTVRDMLTSALSSKYKVGTNKKNYNSPTGLPMTLLTFEPDMDMGVLEMGMIDMGQISRMAELANPKAAIITNIGISHVERLGSRENIFKAKMEVAENFDEDSTLVINGDDDMLKTLKDEEVPYKIVRVGREEGNDFVVFEEKNLGFDGSRFSLKTPEETIKVELGIPGLHNTVNCALAVAGAWVMGLDPSDAIKGIKNTAMTGSRLKETDVSGIRVVDDAYNAAPVSMKGILSILEGTEAKRRIAILGGINELGDLSREEHIGVGKFAAGCNIDMLITVGSVAEDIAKGAKEAGADFDIKTFETKEEIYPLIPKLFKEGDAIIVKASRSYELDQLADEIIKVKRGK